jgi:hypothetical protein
MGGLTVFDTIYSACPIAKFARALAKSGRLDHIAGLCLHTLDDVHRMKQLQQRFATPTQQQAFT